MKPFAYAVYVGEDDRQNIFLQFDHPEMCGQQYKKVIPLYTHLEKEKYLSLQKVDGELIAVTYTDDEHRIVEVLWERPPAKTLTDEEIEECFADAGKDFEYPYAFARAILRKAQEK